MNVTEIDLSNAPHARSGSKVTLIGIDGSEGIGADDWAQWSRDDQLRDRRAPAERAAANLRRAIALGELGHGGDRVAEVDRPFVERTADDARIHGQRNRTLEQL